MEMVLPQPLNYQDYRPKQPHPVKRPLPWPFNLLFFLKLNLAGTGPVRRLVAEGQAIVCQLASSVLHRAKA